MKLRHLLTINIFFTAFFGLSCSLFPSRLLRMYGLPPDTGAIWVTRLEGGSLLGFATLMVLFYRPNSNLRGYYYYGVHGNYISVKQFLDRALWLLWRQLNQRSQRKSYNWKGFKELIEQFQIERPWAE